MNLQWLNQIFELIAVTESPRLLENCYIMLQARYFQSAKYCLFIVFNEYNNTFKFSCVTPIIQHSSIYTKSWPLISLLFSGGQQLSYSFFFTKYVMVNESNTYERN
jgi:hypothetical protein